MDTLWFYAGLMVFIAYEHRANEAAKKDKFIKFICLVICVWLWPLVLLIDYLSWERNETDGKEQ